MFAEPSSWRGSSSDDASSRDHADALCELVDEETRACRRIRRQQIDLRLDRWIVEPLVVEQRQRVNLDVVADDELLASEADAIIGNQRQRERVLRIADVLITFVFGRASACKSIRSTSNASFPS